MKHWWLRLAAFAPAHGRGLASIAGLMLLTTGLNLLKPWPMKILVDSVFGDEPLARSLQGLVHLPGASSPLGLAAWLAASTLLLFAAAWLLQTLQAYLQSSVALRISYALGAQVFEHLQRLSLRFHSRRPAGDLVRRVTTDCRCVQDLILGVIIPVLTATVALVAMAVVMFQLDGQLTVVALLVIPLMVAVNRRYYQPMMERSYDQHQHEGVMLAHAEQTLTALPMVQAFRREAYEQARFRGHAAGTLRAYFRALAYQLKYQAGINGVTALGQAAILVLGGFHVLHGELTVGSLLVFLAYLNELYAPLLLLGTMAATVASVEARSRRVFEVLDHEDWVLNHPEASEHPAQPVGSCRGELTLENVTFGYDPSRPVLNGIDLTIRAGETVALVGPSGAGKSTLASLLLRFFDPTSGRILLDGQDIREVSLAELRAQFAILLQEPFLLPVSIAENIAYGRPTATRHEIEAAAASAQADDFIRRLPEGYDTIVGERGTTLSGGERQRIAISRALLKNAPILILDEPTAALDAATEAALVEGLELLRPGRTTIIIAHRFSTIRSAERIAVLEKGRLAQVGRHEDLIRREGRYRQLYEQQLSPIHA